MFKRSITKEGGCVMSPLALNISFTYNELPPEVIHVIGSGLLESYGIDAYIYPDTEKVSIYGDFKDEELLKKIYTFARQFFTSYKDV